MRRIVSNTGPLLHLGEARALDLLCAAGQVHIPEQVVAEIAYQDTHWPKPEWINIEALADSYTAEATAWQQAGLLDAGEAQAIALAKQVNADWFLTDDAAARLLAQGQGLEVHGSIGIVLWAAAVGLLSRPDASATLQRLARSSLWVSSKILAEAEVALERLFAQ